MKDHPTAFDEYDKAMSDTRKWFWKGILIVLVVGVAVGKFITHGLVTEWIWNLF